MTAIKSYRWLPAGGRMLQVHFACPKCGDSNVTHAHDDDFVFAQIRDNIFYIECGKCRHQIAVRKRRVPGLEVMQ